MKKMKIRLLSAVCFIALTCTCFAQDIIVTKNAKRIDAKVTEVNVDNVRYINAKNPDGPVYTILKSDIASILYQNGRVETFAQESSKPTQPAPAAGQPPAVTQPATAAATNTQTAATKTTPQASAASNAQTGTVGSLNWRIANNTLTISGNGEMRYIGDGKEWKAHANSFTSVVIEYGVKSIGSFAFDECKNVTSITIPNSVTVINDYAFSDCNSLTSITIPNSVTTIGEDAFNNCKRLTSITIPGSVTFIGERAFWGCESLTSVTIPTSVKTIGEGVFRRCDNLTSMTLGGRHYSVKNSTERDNALDAWIRSAGISRQTETQVAQTNTGASASTPTATSSQTSANTSATQETTTRPKCFTCSGTGIMNCLNCLGTGRVYTYNIFYPYATCEICFGKKKMTCLNPTCVNGYYYWELNNDSHGIGSGSTGGSSTGGSTGGSTTKPTVSTSKCPICSGYKTCQTCSGAGTCREIRCRYGRVDYTGRGSEICVTCEGKGVCYSCKGSKICQYCL